MEPPAFSSDETLEEETPSTPLPEEQITVVKKKRTRKLKKKGNSFHGSGHSPTLDFTERVEAWHDYTLGSNIYELAKKFQTSVERIEEAIQAAITELGYPHTHIEPELERFRIVEASDRMKSTQIKLLKESIRTLEEIKQQKTQLRAARKEIHIGKKTSADERALLNQLMAAEAALETRYQLEVKSSVSIMAEYRATNLVIADLTGIKRSKPVRKPKQVQSAEEQLENLTSEQLIEIVGSE